jgi:hypothetical protein
MQAAYAWRRGEPHMRPREQQSARTPHRALRRAVCAHAQRSARRRRSGRCWSRRRRRASAQAPSAARRTSARRPRSGARPSAAPRRPRARPPRRPSASAYGRSRRRCRRQPLSGLGYAGSVAAASARRPGVIPAGPAAEHATAPALARAGGSGLASASHSQRLLCELNRDSHAVRVCIHPSLRRRKALSSLKLDRRDESHACMIQALCRALTQTDSIHGRSARARPQRSRRGAAQAEA